MVVVHRSYVICVSSSGGYRLSACTPHSPLPWFINGICCLSTSFVNQLLNIPLAVAVMASRFRTNRYIHTHNTPRRLFAASDYALNECGKRLSIQVIRLHRCMRGMLQVENFGLVCPGWQYILRSCVFVRFAQTWNILGSNVVLTRYVVMKSLENCFHSLGHIHGKKRRFNCNAYVNTTLTWHSGTTNMIFIRPNWMYLNGARDYFSR